MVRSLSELFLEGRDEETREHDEVERERVLAVLLECLDANVYVLFLFFNKIECGGHGPYQFEDSVRLKIKFIGWMLKINV